MDLRQLGVGVTRGIENFGRGVGASIARELGRNARLGLGDGVNFALDVPNTAQASRFLPAASKLLGITTKRALTLEALGAQLATVSNPKDNIVTALQNLGTGIQNLNVPLGQQRHYVGSDPYAVKMNRAIEAAGASRSANRAPTDAQLRAEGYGVGVHEDDPYGRRSADRSPTDAQLRAEGYGFGAREYDPLQTGVRFAVPAQRPDSRTPGSRSGADIGGDGRGDEARALLSQYAPKPSFPLTPQGQFDRYFGTSGEMDSYFGAASRGAGAPKNVQDMTALAAQRTAPGSTPQDLATYYRAQSAAGRGNMDEIVGGLTYGKAGKEAENLAAWAKANPMLAMREYNKRFPGGQPTMGTGELSVAEALQGTQYQGVGGQGFGAATAPGSVQGMDSTSAFSVPPELKPFTLPGGAFTQGRAVSAPYDTAQAQAAWKTNPQNWTSQGGFDVSKRSEEFLKTIPQYIDFFGGISENPFKGPATINH